MPEEAIDLAHSEILLDVTVTQADGGATVPNSLFGLVNMFARSLFKGHELLFNNEVVSKVPFMSHLSFYIQMLLNYGANAQKSLSYCG